MAKKAAQPVELREVTIAGFEELAAVRFLIKTLEEKEAALKERLTTAFLKPMLPASRTAEVPEAAYLVRDGKTSAKLSLRKRAANQPLQTHETKALIAAGVDVRPGNPTVTLNKSYASNGEVLKKVQRFLALRAEDHDLPGDLFVETKPATTVTDDMVTQIRKMAGSNSTDVLALLDMVVGVTVSDITIDDRDPAAYVARSATKLLSGGKAKKEAA